MRGRINHRALHKGPDHDEHHESPRRPTFVSNINEMNGGVVYSDIGNYNPPVKVNKIIIKNNSLAIKIDAGIPQEDDIYLSLIHI